MSNRLESIPQRGEGCSGRFVEGVWLSWLASMVISPQTIFRRMTNQLSCAVPTTGFEPVTPPPERPIKGHYPRSVGRADPQSGAPMISFRSRRPAAVLKYTSRFLASDSVAQASVYTSSNGRRPFVEGTRPALCLATLVGTSSEIPI